MKKETFRLLIYVILILVTAILMACAAEKDAKEIAKEQGAEEEAAQEAVQDLSDVCIKGPTESFNERYYAKVSDGYLYLKEISGGDWQQVPLPDRLEGKAITLTMDHDFLEIANADREFWFTPHALGNISDMSSKQRKVLEYLPSPLVEYGIRDIAWIRHRGFPFSMGMKNFLPEEYKAWAISNAADGTYTDTALWPRTIGEGGCTHVFVLQEDGQHITWMDGWQPSDWGFEMCSPKRGRFISVNLSSTGGRHMLINEYGDIFTRMYDYDSSGHSPNDNDYFDYTYDDQRGITDDSLRKFQLPVWPWYQQPKISGRITDRISLHRIGNEGHHAMMRVEGWNKEGQAGYYQKDMFDSMEDPSNTKWTFVITNQPVKGTEIENKLYDSSDETLGETEDVCYKHNTENIGRLPNTANPITTSDFAVELLNFGCYVSPALFRVYVGNGDDATYYDLVLHSTQTMRIYQLQDRGLTPYQVQPKSGCIEVPKNLYDNIENLHPIMQAFISTYLNNKSTQITILSDSTYVSWREALLAWAGLSPIMSMNSAINWTFGAASDDYTTKGGNSINGGYGFIYEDLFIHPVAAQIYNGQPSQRNIYTIEELGTKGW
jgi:hypothetical protein